MPVCPDCGPIRRDRDIAGQRRAVRVMCRHQEAEQRAAEAREAAAAMATEAANRYRAIYRREVPEDYQALGIGDLDDRPGSRAGLAAARKYVATWNERRAQGQGLVLSGGIGTGKTLVASAIGNELVETPARVRFTTVTALQAAMKDWDSANDTMASLKTADLLILDDFGQERVTEWAASMLFDLVDGRYQASLPTILTTNLSAKDLRAHYIRSLTHGRDQMPAAQAETTVDRVLSRLRQRNATVVFSGPDQRALADHSWLAEGGAA